MHLLVPVLGWLYLARVASNTRLRIVVHLGAEHVLKVRKAANEAAADVSAELDEARSGARAAEAHRLHPVRHRLKGPSTRTPLPRALLLAFFVWR